MYLYITYITHTHIYNTNHFHVKLILCVRTDSSCARHFFGARGQHFDLFWFFIRSARSSTFPFCTRWYARALHQSDSDDGYMYIWYTTRSAPQSKARGKHYVWRRLRTHTVCVCIYVFGAGCFAAWKRNRNGERLNVINDHKTRALNIVFMTATAKAAVY